MDSVALGWIVFEKTDSAFMVALLAALRMVPLFLLGIFSGLIADNVERRIFLRIFTTLAGSLMALLGVLIIVGYGPENIPNKNNGTIRSAANNATINAESVFSKTIHPKATLSIPNPID
jgi:MFS family permease